MKTGQLVAIGAGAVLGFLLLAKGKDYAQAAGNAINPLSDQNLAYKGASSVGDWFAGDGESVPLGSRLYDIKEATGVRPWQFLNPANAIGTYIGTTIRETFTPTRTSDADAQFSTSFNDPRTGSW